MSYEDVLMSKYIGFPIHELISMGLLPIDSQEGDISGIRPLKRNQHLDTPWGSELTPLTEGNKNG